MSKRKNNWTQSLAFRDPETGKLLQTVEYKENQKLKIVWKKPINEGGNQ
jgi:hypothetical protein